MNAYDIILSAIGTGEAAARPADDLQKLTGLTAREVRKIIEGLRRAGHVIISSDQGYYFPETVEELRRHINKESRRARSIFFTLRSARALLDKWGE